MHCIIWCQARFYARKTAQFYFFVTNLLAKHDFCCMLYLSEIAIKIALISCRF